MGREIKTSNAVFCYTELKELKGGCKIAAYSPSGRRREKVSDYGKYDLMAAKRVRDQILVQIPIRENGKQIKFNIATTGKFRAPLEKDDVSGKNMFSLELS